MKKTSPKSRKREQKKQRKLKTATQKRAETLRRKKAEERKLAKRRSEAARKGWHTRKLHLLEKKLETAARRERAAISRELTKETKILETWGKPKPKPRRPAIKRPVKKPARKPTRRKPPEAGLVTPVKAPAERKPPVEIPIVVEDLITPANVRDYVMKKLQAFAFRERYEGTVNGTILFDGSVAVEGVFVIGRRDYDEFMGKLSTEIQSWGGPYKVSIAPSFDPSKIVRSMEYIELDKVKVGDSNPYDLFRGLIDVPTNFSANVAGQFANMRHDFMPKIQETLGISPDKVRIMILSGDTVMGTQVPRRLAHSRPFDDFD